MFYNIMSIYLSIIIQYAKEKKYSVKVEKIQEIKCIFLSIYKIYRKNRCSI